MWRVVGAGLMIFSLAGFIAKDWFLAIMIFSMGKFFFNVGTQDLKREKKATA